MAKSKTFAEHTGGERIVATVTFHGLLVVATEKNLYAIEENGEMARLKLHPKDISK